MKYLFLASVILILGSVSVHMFDPEFSGKLVGEDNSEIVAKGKKLYKRKGCLGCHGSGGNNPSDESYPLIGGQPRKYLEQQIKDIRDANRTNGMTSIMKASIRGLTNDEAYLISLYLSEL